MEANYIKLFKICDSNYITNIAITQQLVWKPLYSNDTRMMVDLS